MVQQTTVDIFFCFGVLDDGFWLWSDAEKIENVALIGV